MKTTQSFFFQHADNMSSVKTESIGLVSESHLPPLSHDRNVGLKIRILNQNWTEIINANNSQNILQCISTNE